jgi:hypothetical protein
MALAPPRHDATEPPPHVATEPLSLEPDADPATSRFIPPQSISARTERRIVAEFLMRAAESGVVDAETHGWLLALLDATTPPPSLPPDNTPAPLVTPAPPVTRIPPPPPPLATAPATWHEAEWPGWGPAPDRRPAPVGAPTVGPLPPVWELPPGTGMPPPSPQPHRRQRSGRTRPAAWTARLAVLREAVVSDVVLHGFIYLGVLLTVVGMLGFLLFSFKDVPDQVQPLVELGIPAVFFVWAWHLRRQRAVRVGQAMELLGGILLPLVLFASLVDGAPFPPNPSGSNLILAMAMTSLALAGGYAWWSARSGSSALAYLVAPAIWLAAMAVGFAFKGDEPLVGDAITRLVSAQPALAAVAITGTLAATARWATHRLSRPTTVAAGPGAAIAYLMVVTLAAGEGWTPWPLVVAGAATLASAELLSRRRGWEQALVALRPALLAATVAPLLSVWGTAWGGVAAVVVFLLLLEVELRAPRVAPTGVLVAAGAITIGLALSMLDPWAAVVAWASATVWAHSRRSAGVRFEPVEEALLILAATLPLGLGWALLGALGTALGLLISGTLLLTAVAAARMSRSDDPFWIAWPVAGAAVVISVTTWSWYLGDTSTLAWGAMAGAATAAAGVFAWTPKWPVSRVWATSVAASLALAIGLQGAAVPDALVPAVWAAIGVALVATATARPLDPGGHLAAVGHLVGLGALLAAATGWSRVVCLTAWTVGWLLAVVAAETGRSSVGGALAASGGRSPSAGLAASSRLLPVVVLAVSLPATVLVWLEPWGRLTATGPWTALALALVSLLYAAVTREFARRRPLAPVLAVSATLLAGIAVAVAFPDRWSVIGAATSSVAVAVVLPRPYRHRVYLWFAWLMTGLVALLLSEQAGLPPRLFHAVVTCWGGALLIGALAFDGHRAGRRRSWQELRIGPLWDPAAIGAVAVLAGLAAAAAEGARVLGWWSLIAAAIYLAAALLLRAGAASMPVHLLVVLGTSLLLPWSPLERPWILAVLAAGMVGCAWVLERVTAPRTSSVWWSRWDLPPLLTAHLVALVALGLATTAGEVATTWTTVGGLSLVVAWWRHQRVWAEVGTLLVLGGAGAAGPGWLAGALLATALRGMVGAALSRGRDRISYHAIGVLAAAGAWIQLAVWQQWSASLLVSASALAFGALAVSVAAAARLARLPRDWTLVWGTLATVGSAAAAAGAVEHLEGFLPAAGMGLYAVGAALLVRPFGPPTSVAVAPAAAAIAWLEVVAGARWEVEPALVLTSLLAGTLALVIAALARSTSLGRPWLVSWGTLTVTALLAVGFGSFAPDGSFRDVGLATAVGAAMLAISSALAARPIWPPLHHLAVIATGWAWSAALLGLGWNDHRSAVATALAFGGLAVFVVELARSRLARASTPGLAAHARAITRFWSALAVAGLLSSIVLAISSIHRPVWFAVAAGTVFLGAAAARGPAVLELPLLRELAGLSALAAPMMVAHGLQASTAAMAGLAIGAGLLATLVALVLWRSTDASITMWVRPLAAAGVAASAQAAVLAGVLWPRSDVLAGTLLALGVQAAASGLALRRPALLSLAPGFVLAAWLVIAGESLGGNVQWYTAPIAVALLIEVDVARWDRRLRGASLPTRELLLLEWSGVGLLALPSLTQMFTQGLVFAVVAAASAAALLFWAVVSRVRRRVIASAALATATSVLTIAAAVAGRAPASAIFWILIVGVGFTVMLVVAMVEAYRSRTGHVMARFDQLAEGWE